jgi:hypothetical protein
LQLADRAHAQLISAGDIENAEKFLTAISRTRRDLAANSSLTGAIGDKWSNIFTVRTTELKEAGVTTKDRKFFLWAREKFRQGADPALFITDAKPKKKVRGYVHALCWSSFHAHTC